jgi:hypothetical protein
MDVASYSSPLAAIIMIPSMTRVAFNVDSLSWDVFMQPGFSDAAKTNIITFQ